MSDLPKARGSVRPVTIENDPDQRTYYCEVRAASPQTGLQVGAIVWVNFGTQTKIEGQWRQCVILPSSAATASGVHVKLSPEPSTEPFG